MDTYNFGIILIFMFFVFIALHLLRELSYLEKEKRLKTKYIEKLCHYNNEEKVCYGIIIINSLDIEKIIFEKITFDNLNTGVCIISKKDSSSEFNLSLLGKRKIFNGLRKINRLRCGDLIYLQLSGCIKVFRVLSINNVGDTQYSDSVLGEYQNILILTVSKGYFDRTKKSTVIAYEVSQKKLVRMRKK